MARSVFVDTWGWLTLRDRHETRHQEIADFYQSFRGKADSLATTDYILDETFTLIFKRLPLHQAHASVDMLIQATNSKFVQLEWITPARFARTLVLRERFQDKPNISFTDLSSMAVMEELGMSTILTQDAHFTHTGMGFHLVP